MRRAKRNRCGHQPLAGETTRTDKDRRAEHLYLVVRLFALVGQRPSVDFIDQARRERRLAVHPLTPSPDTRSNRAYGDI